MVYDVVVAGLRSVYIYITIFLYFAGCIFVPDTEYQVYTVNSVELAQRRGRSSARAFSFHGWQGKDFYIRVEP